MCLSTRQKHVKFAKEEIPCYKVFKVDNAGIPFTPFIHRYITIEELTGKKPLRAIGAIEKSKSFDGAVFDYGRGLIHAYKEMPDDPVRNLFYGLSENIIVCKCHIPKRTRYTENNEEIAAKRIVIDEIIFDSRKRTRI